jgi:hypothetical protein
MIIDKILPNVDPWIVMQVIVLNLHSVQVEKVKHIYV